MTLAILIAVVVAFLAVGIAMLVSGLCGRVIDGHPVCRRCRFDLVGSVPGLAKCPECGSALDGVRAITIGNRRRRPLYIGAGAVVMLLSIGGGCMLLALQMGAAGIAALAPSRVLALVPRLTDPWTNASRAAIVELGNRLGRNELPAELIHDLAIVGLDVQADRTRPWNPIWGDFAIRSRMDSTMNDEEWVRFLRQAMPTITLRMPALAEAGTRVTISLDLSDDARFASSGNLTHRLESWTTTIGDVILDHLAEAPIGTVGVCSMTESASGSAGSFGRRRAVPDVPGEYPASMTFTLELSEVSQRGIARVSQTLASERPLIVVKRKP